MKFEEIPKRLEKSEISLNSGFWFRVRNMTNTLGDSPFGNIVIVLATPLIFGLLSLLLFSTHFLTSVPFSGEMILDFILLVVIRYTLQVLAIWGVYAYIFYIAFQQIKYDINRVTGIISIVLMTLGILPLMTLMSLFSVG